MSEIPSETLEKSDSEPLDTSQATSIKDSAKLEQEERRKSLGDVLFVEKEIISQQRAKRLPDESLRRDYYGIAISGGGIRSASFGLGILQALCHRGELKYFDYISAVSGGGYIASCLTWFNHQKRHDPEFQRNDSITPFCKLFNTDIQVKLEETSEPKKTGYKEKTPLNYLRQNGRYLNPTKGLNIWAFVSAVVGNALVAAAVYFSLFIAVFWLLHKLYFYTEFATDNLGPFNSLIWGGYTTWAKLLLHLLGYILLVFVLLSALNTIRVDKQKEDSIVQGILAKKYRNRRNLQIWIGRTAFITAVIAILATLPDAWHIISSLYPSMNENEPNLGLGGTGVLLGVIGAIYHFFRENFPAKKNSIVTDIRIILTALMLVYSVLFFAWEISDAYPPLLELLFHPSDSKKASWQITTISIPLSFWIIAIIPLLIVILGWVMNINYFGIRQMYRDRLMEVFLPDLSNFDQDVEHAFEWHPATEADQANIHDMCGAEDFGPYLILNANAVLMNSNNARYRNRGGDNYILSSQFIGCSATGWYPITQLGYPVPLTLGAAMSISGAAVNPHAGVGGQGLTRNRLVSMIMGFLNIRLGYWIQNPASKVRWITKLLNPPSLLYPGFFRGVLGLGGDENNDYIELTDGGHFDNTGLYELIRRRLRVILLSQAGADPDFTVDDIGNAIQRARADFGVHVNFVPGYGLNELIPGTGKAVGLSSKIELSNRPYAIALIKYAEDEFGVLIIIKTVLTKGLSADLYSYKLSHKTFPNQSTTDQFFEEDQFEAYRELGFGLCHEMLKGEFGEKLSLADELVEAVRSRTLPAYKPSVEEWTIEDCLSYLGEKRHGPDPKNSEDSEHVQRLRNACKEKIREAER